ncbi:hypothetical protein Celaphus_00006661 [Cervus elaphus hippelaphus]|uniref:Uncharacterized protein n=1 Tax=Cervus elaphus hippelaphus TaxID=46360 RepID=A0A212CUK1_CEREH|nr:hypothetical protein Celaphus_00006661 [Cervus elaphus hippelaphus]
MKLQRKHYGYHLDYHEKKRREGRRQKKMFGLKAKLYHAQLHVEKIHMKKMHEKRNSQTEA